MGRIRWRWAVITLAVAGCQARPPYEGKSVAELQRQLGSADPALQVQAAFGLSRLGPEARAATQALAEALQSPNALVRGNAALALGEIGPDAATAVPALTEALKDKEWTVRRHAAVALGRIGPEARSAVGALKKMTTQDADEMVRKAAAEAVGKLER